MGKNECIRMLFEKRIKLPFVDWYLVRGADIRKFQENRALRNKLAGRLLNENYTLKKRLRRYEGSRDERM